MAGSPPTVIAVARSVGSRLGATPPSRGSAPSTASSMRWASLAVKTGSVNPKRAASRRTEDLGVGQRLVLRLDHRFRALQPVRAVSRVDVVVLEVARGGQHHVRV